MAATRTVYYDSEGNRKVYIGNPKNAPKSFGKVTFPGPRKRKDKEPTRTTRNLKRKKVAQPRGRTSKIGKTPITKPTNPKTDIFKKRFLNNSSSVTTNFRKGGRAK
jgi:hypothetical protein